MVTSMLLVRRPTPAPLPTPQRPTPLPPQMPTSHVSENFGESGKSGPVSRVAGKFLGVVALAKNYDRKGKLKHAEEAT